MKNEDITTEKHAANAKQVASWSLDHKAYTDWLSFGDLEVVIKENEVQAVADLPATMFDLLGEIHDAGSTDEASGGARRQRRIEYAMQVDVTVLQRLVDEMEWLIQLNDDGESDPTAPALRPKPSKGEDGPGSRP